MPLGDEDVPMDLGNADVRMPLDLAGDSGAANPGEGVAGMVGMDSAIISVMGL